MTWLQLRRLMQQAGWIRVERTYCSPGRDEDGAPWDDGSYQFMWKRYGPDPEDGAEEINAFWDLSEQELVGSVGYWPYGADHDLNHAASVGVPMIEDHGLDWLHDLMKICRIIP